MTTSSFFHPSLILIIGAILLPFVRGPFRKPYLILIPILTLSTSCILEPPPASTAKSRSLTGS